MCVRRDRRGGDFFGKRQRFETRTLFNVLNGCRRKLDVIWGFSQWQDNVIVFLASLWVVSSNLNMICQGCHKRQNSYPLSTLTLLGNFLANHNNSILWRAAIEEIIEKREILERW
jgi:hypothetical protein